MAAGSLPGVGAAWPCTSILYGHVDLHGVALQQSANLMG